MHGHSAQSARTLLTTLALLATAAPACTSKQSDDYVLADVGGTEKITVGDMRRRYSEVSPDLRARYEKNPKGFLVDQVAQDEALYQAAKRRGLTPLGEGKPRDTLIAAMKKQLLDDLQSTFSDVDVTPADMARLVQGDPRYAFVPERINVIAMSFARRDDATRAAAEAKGPAGRTDEGFRAVYFQAEKRLRATAGAAETWDFDVFRDLEAGWPPAALDALFVAKVGAVLGPFEAKMASDKQKRFYVLKVVRHFGEVNGFEQLKPRLQMMARDVKLQGQLIEAMRSVSEKAVAIADEATLGALQLSSAAGPASRSVRE